MGLLDQYNNLDKETQDSLGKTGTKINTAGAHLVTIESMQSIEDKRVKIVFKDALSADIELRIPETKKADKVIDFKAKIDLDEGIIRTAEWLRNYDSTS